MKACGGITSPVAVPSLADEWHDNRDGQLWRNSAPSLADRKARDRFIDFCSRHGWQPAFVPLPPLPRDERVWSNR